MSYFWHNKWWLFTGKKFSMGDAALPIDQDRYVDINTELSNVEVVIAEFDHDQTCEVKLGVLLNRKHAQYGVPGWIVLTGCAFSYPHPVSLTVYWLAIGT